tara:strand:- start:5947 stop:6729 length:783 start_codon:yes stop_codon:yes gene_type:complete
MPYTVTADNDIFALVLFKHRIAKRSMYELDARGNNPYFLHFASDDALCYEHQLDIGLIWPKSMQEQKTITITEWEGYVAEVTALKTRLQNIVLKAHTNGKRTAIDHELIELETPEGNRESIINIQKSCEEEKVSMQAVHRNTMGVVEQQFNMAWRSHNLPCDKQNRNNPTPWYIVKPSEYKELAVPKLFNFKTNLINIWIEKEKNSVFKWRFKDPLSSQTKQISEQKWLRVKYTFNRINFFYTELILQYASWVKSTYKLK